MSLSAPLSHDSAARTEARAAPRAVALWLLGVAALIFAMAVIGAITRLTESGLSIMEWAPISGALPPLTTAEWERLLELYRRTAEYQQINRGMSLAEFREIFWWEWVHRQWGRLIGLAFALPLAWFWLRGRLPGWIKPYLLVALGLGALQGFMGWFMVASGFFRRAHRRQPVPPGAAPFPGVADLRLPALAGAQPAAARAPGAGGRPAAAGGLGASPGC